ncbi:MAG: hypothetical protein JWQ39_509 [Glaciihabitans sp.]|jgi:hypothetical protein|nr:hypothetical protein [Glaciihabitans sp.]
MCSPSTKEVEAGMWATTENGTPATPAELLERMHAAATYTARLAVRDGRVHNLQAQLDELALASGERLERPLDRETLVAAISGALRRECDALELRVELYRHEDGPASRILVIATEWTNRDLSDPLRLRTVDGIAAHELRSSPVDEEYGVPVIGDLIADPLAGSLCFVSDHRFIWPESLLARTSTARAIDARVRDLGHTSVRLPVTEEHLDAFDGAFLIRSVGPSWIGSIDEREFSLNLADLRTLQAAFELGPWAEPGTLSITAGS